MDKMMKGNKEFHLYNESPIFQDISILSVEKTKTGRNVILHNDGSVSVLLKFDGINNSSFAEEDYEYILNKITNFTTQIHDTSISVQFIMMRESSDPNIKTDHLPSYLKPRAEYRKVLARDHKLFENSFYIAIHSKSASSNKNEGFIKKGVRLYKRYIRKEQEMEGKKAEYYKDAFRGIKLRTKSALNTSDNIKQLISDIGGEFRVVKTKKEIYNILQKFLRPKKHRMGEYKNKDNPDEGRTGLIDIEREAGDVPRKALFSGVRVENYKNHFELDGYYHKVFQLDRCPKNLIYGHTVDAIESVPFEFIYSVTFRKKPVEEAKKALNRKYGQAIAEEGAAQGGMTPDFASTVKREKIEGELIAFEEQEGIGIDISANFVLRVDKEYIARRCRETGFTEEELLMSFDQDLQTKVFTQFGASEWVSEPRTDWKIFSKLIPGCSDIKSTYLKKQFVTAENLPYFLAIYDNRRDVMYNGTNHFVDLRGSQVNFDLFDSNLAAWNYSISGQTGSGKSVLVNALLTMQFAETAGDAQGPIICILDVGGDRGSYTKTLKLHNGSQINLSGVIKPSIQLFSIEPDRSFPTPNKKVSLRNFLISKNPDVFKNTDEDLMDKMIDGFYLKKLNKTSISKDSYENDLEQYFEEFFQIKMTKDAREAIELQAGECEPSPRKMNLILGCLEVMLSTNAKNRLDAFDNYGKDELSKLILLTYRSVGEEKKRCPYMSDFVALGHKELDKKEIMVRKMLVKLENWTKQGANGMFDRDTDVDMESDIILADLKGLEDYPELQMIYTMLVSELFNNKMYFIKDRRKIIVRDEAWSLMSNERARNYFVEDLRTARKNGFATIAISQLPTDYLYPDRQAGLGIITNFQVNIFCRFSTESIAKTVGEEYKLPPAVVAQMSQLGVQREMQPDGSKIPTHSRFMMLIEEENKRSVYVLKNLLHPFEYILYSSSASDNAIIDYYMEKTKSYTDLEEVLWLVANRNHYGDLGLAEYLDNVGQKSEAQKIKRYAKSS